MDTAKVYCIITDNVIEINDKLLWKVRGIKPAIFGLTHPVYEVTKMGWSFLKKNGFVQVSQADYCKLHNLPDYRSIIEQRELNSVGDIVRVVS